MATPSFRLQLCPNCRHTPLDGYRPATTAATPSAQQPPARPRNSLAPPTTRAAPGCDHARPPANCSLPHQILCPVPPAPDTCANWNSQTAPTTNPHPLPQSTPAPSHSQPAAFPLRHHKTTAKPADTPQCPPPSPTARPCETTASQTPSAPAAAQYFADAARSPAASPAPGFSSPRQHPIRPLPANAPSSQRIIQPNPLPKPSPPCNTPHLTTDKPPAQPRQQRKQHKNQQKSNDRRPQIIRPARHLKTPSTGKISPPQIPRFSPESASKNTPHSRISPDLRSMTLTSRRSECLQGYATVVDCLCGHDTHVPSHLLPHQCGCTLEV